MPTIKNQYLIQLPVEIVYTESLASLKEMGATDIKEVASAENIKSISCFIASAWGWGGMQIAITTIPQENSTIIEPSGYIAQLVTAPLSKKLNEFLDILAQRLQTKYNYLFVHGKANALMQGSGYHLNRSDLIMIAVVLIATFVITLSGALVGRRAEIGLSIGVLILGYILGRKYFYKQ